MSAVLILSESAPGERGGVGRGTERIACLAATRVERVIVLAGSKKEAPGALGKRRGGGFQVYVVGRSVDKEHDMRALPRTSTTACVRPSDSRATWWALWVNSARKGATLFAARVRARRRVSRGHAPSYRRRAQGRRRSSHVFGARLTCARRRDAGFYENQLCFAPWTHVLVTWDGKVPVLHDQRPYRFARRTLCSASRELQKDAAPRLPSLRHVPRGERAHR